MIPVSTTTITVQTVTGSPYDTQTAVTRSRGTRAHISAPSGLEQAMGGTQTTIDARLSADPVTIGKDDRVVDERTSETWEVVWAMQRHGFGLDHVEAGLRRWEGAA